MRHLSFKFTEAESTSYSLVFYRSMPPPFVNLYETYDVGFNKVARVA